MTKVLKVCETYLVAVTCVLEERELDELMDHAT